MDGILTWSGKCFGYGDGDDLWTYKGITCWQDS